MGQEAECRAWFNGKATLGKAHLDSVKLTYRGPIRFDVTLAQLRNTEAKDGQLKLGWADGEAILELGPAAEKWAAKIRNPPSRLDKLGVKPGQRIATVGINDEEFLHELEQRVATTRATKDCDLIFCAIESPADLPRAERLAASMKSGAALWTIFPKGRKEFGETAIRTHMRAAGMIDVKVAAFSPTHSSLKWTGAR